MSRQLLPSQDFSWPFWPLLPLYPFGRRQTLRREVVKDTIWTFDQLQGIFYVVVPIRMSVIKLDRGGLLIYAPVAPTPECLRLLGELVAKHGDVKYIILPTSSGLEHKIFVGPFARCFPEAQVFVAPDQWSFPLNLPLSWLGFPRKRTHLLPEDSRQVPFASEFDYAPLGTIDLGLGQFAEVAFWHSRSQTLLVTDSVIAVPEEPPEIVQLDPYPLLFHGREGASEAVVEDTFTNRRRGWQRICLFSLYFQPSALEVPPWGQVLREALRASDRTKQNYFGLYPFQWRSDWQQSFATLQGGGRLLVAPILQTLILNRAPQETLAWVEKVASWQFQQIIPCHFSAPIAAGPAEFRQAFGFLQPSSQSSPDYWRLPPADFMLLKKIDAGLGKIGVLPPAK